ncbi:hypothetical protein GCM10020219_092740 [Nonomuraea dietziae]
MPGRGACPGTGERSTRGPWTGVEGSVARNAIRPGPPGVIRAVRRPAGAPGDRGQGNRAGDYAPEYCAVAVPDDLRLRTDTLLDGAVSGVALDRGDRAVAVVLLHETDVLMELMLLLPLQEKKTTAPGLGVVPQRSLLLNHLAWATV